MDHCIQFYIFLIQNVYYIIINLKKKDKFEGQRPLNMFSSASEKRGKGAKASVPVSLLILLVWLIHRAGNRMGITTNAKEQDSAYFNLASEDDDLERKARIEMIMKKFWRQ